MRKTDLLKKLTKKGGNILITTHVFPDADGIGSEIALCLALRKKGINAICVNEEILEERYRYLDKNKAVKSLTQFKRDKKKKWDILVVVDTNSIKMIGPKMNFLAQKMDEIIFIDHHPINEKKLIPKNIFLRSDLCATGEVVGNLIEDMEVKFNYDIAICLYTAILIDTSSFRYPKVSEKTHTLLAKLLKSGVNPPKAYNLIYGTKKLSHMKLLGKILSSIKSTKDQSIAWIIVKEDDLIKYLTKAENTNSFINNLLVLDNLKVACLFRELKGKVKISLRSHGSVNVGSIAEELGGGGHSHSAGAFLKGDISSVVKKVIRKIKSRL
jgi:bifunctional oligoribonuclease and PAP phosphatase NrnA